MFHFSFQIVASNSLLMYCVHSMNILAFEVLLEFNADLLWTNNTEANICQILAKKGLLILADKCWNILEGKPEEDRYKFLNNQSYNGKSTIPPHSDTGPHFFKSFAKMNLSL